ncbi:hypothetical protein [Gordonia aquimaris]|uniref:Integral membrane protein n=1 Tax=Gordonia aquimaris TaxID=2984863 RepID=A0A9X3I6E3_9ACTN|nr:hypothetical protein [Gordonia aquimaris]MCX2966732.1 hypothetical protein [Gordonia aquimaris]
MADTVTEDEREGHNGADVAAPPPVRLRRDIVSVCIAVLLVSVAALVPLVFDRTLLARIFAEAPPLFAHWLPHTGPGTVPAIVIAVLAVVAMPALALRLSFVGLCVVTWAWALAWTVSLALIDGPQRGYAGRLERPDEYLSEVPGVASIPTMLREFADRIVDGQPDSWTTHVSGHPPGALLSFVVLDRIGLGGGAWAGTWCIVTGTSAAVAVLIAVRRLGDERWARRCAPFLVLFPGWVWVGVSADGYFMAVAAWGVALIAVAATERGRRRALWATVAGVLLGFGIFLSYGLILVGVVALAVLLAARTARPLPWACAGALIVVVAFWASGFWWLDGYHLVVERYYQGIASDRPFAYWGWANLAATLCVLGPAAAAGVGRAFRWPPRRMWHSAPTVLLLGGLAAIVIADLSALSKAETERIWLPFSLWVMVGTGLLPIRHQRIWLVLQATLTLLVNHLLLTYW